MRHSHRDNILDAAIRVIERDGVTGVTFDAVAAEAGVTRGGLMYHFKSREALIEAINAHLAAQWEAGLERTAGKPADRATPEERAAAWVWNSTAMATRAELLFLLEFARDPALAAPWDAVAARWSTPPPEDLDDADALARFIVRLAADGLWTYEYLSNQPLPLAVRQRVARQLTGLAASPAKRPDPAAAVTEDDRTASRTAGKKRPAGTAGRPGDRASDRASDSTGEGSGD